MDLMFSGIMLPSIFKEHEICSNRTESLRIVK